MKKILALLLVLSVVWFSGCGSSSVKKTDQLPPLGDRLDNLDGGLSVAAPAGWQIRPRSGNFLARFVGADNADYPTLLVTSKASESISGTLTEANVPAFAAELKLPSNDFMVLGDDQNGQKVFVGYSPANSDYDRQCLATVKNGTIYTVELRIQKNLLSNDHIGFLKAVAAGMNWSSSAPTVGTAPADEAESTNTDFPAIGSALEAPETPAAPEAEAAP